MESCRKNKLNYKTSNFFTGFHHIAYLESIKSSYGKPREAKQVLPKLSYLAKKSNPRIGQYLEIRQRRNHKNNTEIQRSLKEDTLEIDQCEEICNDGTNLNSASNEEEQGRQIEDLINVNESKSLVAEKSSFAETESSEEAAFVKVLRELEDAQVQFQKEILESSSKEKNSILATETKAQRSIESTNVATRLLENWKTLIVQEKESSVKESSGTWDESKSLSDISETIAKFPRETKTAMMVLLNRSKANAKTPDKKAVKQVDTQTSPDMSTTQLYLPCVKNLLCTKGFHSGNCDGDSPAVSDSSNSFSSKFDENII